ncbi:MlaE family ABC transporter permease [Pseudonocardia sp. CA-107938]|uniref:MlaE family ABC transporter permease n=1 Tax=Pseudonocardia sp. CA-107938 TaxID=3240021 RepID=UPI003D8F1342
MAARAPARSMADSPLGVAVRMVGELIAFAMATAIATVRVVVGRRLSLAETAQQTWFIASVTTLPALLITIPLGVVIATTVGSLAGQLGAQSYTGAVVALVVIGQSSPLICALMISGVGGSAICADLGARTIREETDALEVMGVSVIERLVVPRVIAATIVTLLLNGLVMAVGIGASLLVQVWVLDNSLGGFLTTMTQFARVSDFVVAGIKAFCFAVAAAIVAAWKGLTTKSGPAGVGNAVNEAVVLAFLLVFVVNVTLTELYPVIVPAKGAY